MWPWITVRLIESESWNWVTFWQSSSAVATTVGVLIALLTPLYSRLKAKKKVIESCLQLIKSIDQISEIAAGYKSESCEDSSLHATETLFGKSSIYRTMNFEIWDMYSHEFSKYEPEQYIVFLKIVSSARSIQESAISWENCILQKLDGGVEKFFSNRLNNRIINLTTVFDENMENLKKWGVK